jgi:protein TonB
MTEIPGAGGGSVGGHDGQGTGDGSGAGTGGGFGDGAGGGAQAGYISGSRPAYPREALRAGWEGTVVIRVLVGADGLPAATSVRSSSGYGALDDAAAQAIKQWRFTPARRGGNPVDSYFDVRVKFSLADASGL